VTQIFKNNASSRLAGALTATATTLKVDAGTGSKFPAPTPGNFFMVTVEDRRTGQIEICKCTARSGDTLTIVRAQEDTTNQAFALGSTVSNRLTAGTLELYVTPSPGSNQYYWDTRAQFVSAISAGFIVITGYTYVAGGFTYLGKVGSTAIPDLPGVIPFGDVHVEHFGAKGDLEWAMKTFPSTECIGIDKAGNPVPNYSAPYRLGGTDDYVAFDRADSYTSVQDSTNPNPNAIGTGVFYAEADGYYIGQQFILRGMLRSRRGFRSYLWLHNKNMYHCCIWINSSNGGVVGFNIIDQYEYTTSKPAGAGQMGPGITCTSIKNTEGGPATYQRGDKGATIPDPEILTNIEIDVRFCRSGDGTPAGFPTQRSAGAYHLIVAGGHEFSKFTCGIFRKTNSGSNGLCLAHYGCTYKDVTTPIPGLPPGPGDPITNFHGMEIVNTWHCCDCEFNFVGYMDCGENPHNFLNIFATAGAGAIEISDIACRGVQALYLTPGDIVNHYAIPRQKDKVMKGIRYGYITCIDMPALTGPMFTNPSTGEISHPTDPFGNPTHAPVHYTGLGTSQHLFDKYPGTVRQRTRQIDVDIQGKGCYLARLSLKPGWNSRGFYGLACLGKINPGAITTWGIGRGYELEWCDGDQQLNYVEGDGSLLYEFSRGGRLLQTDTDKGNVVTNPDEGGYAPGFGGITRAISVAGGTYSTEIATTMPGGDPMTIPAGSEQTPIVPFTGADDDVYIGSPVKIGNNLVTTTDCINGQGVFTITISRLTKTNPARVVLSVLDICRLANDMLITVSGATGDMSAANGSMRIRNINYNTNDYDFGVSRGVFDLYTAAGVPVNLSGAAADLTSTAKMSTNLPGVPYLIHSPLPTDVHSGDIVTVDETSRIKQLSVTSAGGQSALRASIASVDNLDMHGLRWAGKYGASLISARVSMSGPMPLTVGRDRMSAGNNYTINGDANSLCSVKDSTILKNPNIAAHFLFTKIDGGGGGHIDLRNCRIQDLDTLVLGSDGTKRYILSMYGCTDVTDNRMLSHPARQGSNANGFYHYAEDGMLNQWVRNLVTGADGTVLWTFPFPFNVVVGGTDSIVVSPTMHYGNVGSLRMVTVIGFASTSARIQVLNSAGAPDSGAVVSARAVGRWYAE